MPKFTYDSRELVFGVYYDEASNSSFGGDRYAHVRVMVGAMFDRKDGAQFESVSYDTDGPGAFWFGGFVTSCQIDNSPNNPNSYAHAVGFDKTGVTELRDMERMVKTLRYINARMAKIESEFGAPSDFAALVGYVANALGVKRFAIRSRRERPASWYQLNEWRMESVESGVRDIRYNVARLREDCVGAKAQSA